MPTFNYFL